MKEEKHEKETLQKIKKKWKGVKKRKRTCKSKKINVSENEKKRVP